MAGFQLEEAVPLEMGLAQKTSRSGDEVHVLASSGRDSLWDSTLHALVFYIQFLPNLRDRGKTALIIS